MLIQGVHPKIVSERLGHASIGITLDTYSHVLPSMQSEAATAFDQLFTPTSINNSAAEANTGDDR
jgi:integrase